METSALFAGFFILCVERLRLCRLVCFTVSFLQPLQQVIVGDTDDRHGGEEDRIGDPPVARPVIIVHSDMPPMPASSVSGMKIVVMKVSRRTMTFVSLAGMVMWLFIRER